MYGQHAVAELVLDLRHVAISFAEHVGQLHDVILTCRLARLAGGVLVDAFPVRLHVDRRAFALDAVVINDLAFELPAVDLVRHDLLDHRHRALPCCPVARELSPIPRPARGSRSSTRASNIRACVPDRRRWRGDCRGIHRRAIPGSSCSEWYISGCIRASPAVAAYR